jgi:hypothetical protein
MAPDDESRHDLFVLLERDTSRETAAGLMRHVPPDGWPEFATKADLAVVAERMRADIREQATRMIRWSVSTGLAAVGVAAAVTGVVATAAG